MAYTLRGSGPPLLWMSGYVVPVAAFSAVLDQLAETFTVVAVDQRGSGSSRTRLWPTTTRTMAGDAISVLDELGVDAAQVVGTSLGGMVAQEIAIGWPHRVRSLVLCSTTAGGPGAKTPPAGQLLAEMKQTARCMPGGVKVRPLGALHQMAAAVGHDATRGLHKIQAPTLVLHGSEDRLVPVANATWLASRIHAVEVKVIHGGTHLLVLESAAARVEVRTWLAEHRDAHLGKQPRLCERVADASYRAVLSQTLPLRRAIRVGSGLLRGPSRPKHGAVATRRRTSPSATPRPSGAGSAC